MSVALWLAAMPPPAWTKRMIASFWAWLHSGPGRLPPVQMAETLKSRIASYFARFSSVKMRAFLSALSQLFGPPPLLSQSSQSTV